MEQARPNLGAGDGDRAPQVPTRCSRERRRGEARPPPPRGQIATADDRRIDAAGDGPCWPIGPDRSADIRQARDREWPAQPTNPILEKMVKLMFWQIGSMIVAAGVN